MRQISSLFVTLTLGLALGPVGCADPVKDIDRTQGNFIKKSDLDGEWYVLQTVTDVPSTSFFTFVGETSAMERIRWEIREDVLIGYRSYQLLRGSEAPSTGVEFDGKENPIVAYRIQSHFDVIRDYNSSTGEQSNIIVENTSDRLWHQRDFMRVDWSQSLVLNWNFIAPVTGETMAAYYEHEEEAAANGFRRETDDDGVTQYFDVGAKMIVEPDLWGCIYSWYGLSAEDCTSAEIGYRTSFARVGESTYEPFNYSDQLMSRFGYFRTEFFTYDEQRGVVDAGRRYMIQRHHIWQASVDADGTPIPIGERAQRTVPYYLSPNFPQDPLLVEAAAATINQWNQGMKQGLAAVVTGEPEDVFVLCHNPVTDGDDDACGATGLAPRLGDLRYSSLHWVDTETLAGLLGYGPSAADPITGEIISGKAYVYGAAVSTWAQYAVDVLRYFNEDLELETLIRGDQFSEVVAERLLAQTRRPEPDARLAQVPVTRPIQNRKEPRGRPARPEVRPRDLKPYDSRRVADRLEAARKAGKTPMLMNDEIRRAMERTAGADLDTLSDADRDRLDPARSLNPVAFKRMNALRRKARARSVDMHDMIAPDLIGLAQKYAGRTDYDEVWRELRAEIFASTAEHEVGHTVGLRHNFQGSYDSLNFPDQFWDLRSENLDPDSDGDGDLTLADIYKLSELTPKQSEGQMRQKQYSSIMDYGYSWQNDINGVGKYDVAALVFGYTAGSRPATGADCDTYESVPTDDGCLANTPGLIEVFKKTQNQLGRAGEILDRSELGFSFDDPGLPSITALERFHYTTVARAFPSLGDLGDGGREYLPYHEFLGQKDGDNRKMRVPYLFCSDEWEGGLISCHAFDQGMDPFELTLSKIYDYRAYYPFVNFRRDRPSFEVWHPLDTYYYRIFLPLSDYFQSWYLAPYGDDPLFDRTYDLAISAGFNLLGEVMATPEYGTWCEAANGQMIFLDDEPVLQGVVDDDPECVPDGRTIQVEKGAGRRAFSAYDAKEGYYFADKPLEAGHYWATLAAVWAITDPEAFVIGVEGDAGTYAISYFDWFDQEFNTLMNGLLTNDYGRFAPRAVPQEDGSVKLKYVPASPLFDNGNYFDPETGEAVDLDPTLGPLAGPAGLCDICTNNRDCAGNTGGLGGTYCVAVGETPRCIQDCTNDAGLCVAGTTCDDGGNCIPDDGDCAPFAGACGANFPLGRCSPGSTCVGGRCQDYPWEPVLQAEPTFSLATDILFYGFLFTTSSYSTKFNDQLNVFRPGNGTEVEGDPLLTERHNFTDPLTGVTYAAVQPRCDEESTGGSVSLCASCDAHEDCAGYNGGFFGGIFCVQLEGSLATTCVQDCTNDATLCGDGFDCDADGNCQPDGGSCAPADCSPAAPFGACPAGFTCAGGTCDAQATNQCTYLGQDDTGAVQLVKRGQQLAQRYDTALGDWYGFNGDAAEDNRRARIFFRERYRLTRFVELVETLLATYNIFGHVY